MRTALEVIETDALKKQRELARKLVEHNIAIMEQLEEREGLDASSVEFHPEGKTLWSEILSTVDFIEVLNRELVERDSEYVNRSTAELEVQLDLDKKEARAVSTGGYGLGSDLGCLVGAGDHNSARAHFQTQDDFSIKEAQIKLVEKELERRQQAALASTGGDK